jgi:hypothetical protein
MNTRGRRIRTEATRCRVLLTTAVVTFFCVQLVGGEAIERFRPGIRYEWLEERLAALRRQPRTPDLVYLGSSRFCLGLDAAELSCELGRHLDRPDFRAVGAAVPAGDFLVMERVLDEMDRIGMHPPTVVVEVVPFHLLDVNPWYNVHLYQILTWADLGEHLAELTRGGQFGRMLGARLTPLVIHRYAILKNLLTPTLHAKASERCPVPQIDDAELARLLEPTPNTPDEIEQARSDLEVVARHYRRRRIGGTSTASLERILTRFARHGTRVILVGAPLSSAHREALAPVDAAYCRYMERIQARFGVSFVDCRAALPDALFEDHHHLKRLEGTIVFSRYLAREVLMPLLEDASPPANLVTLERMP